MSRRSSGMQWHQLDHMQTICISLQTDNNTNTSSLNFYRPDALPDAQPTVSKHWRHLQRTVTSPHLECYEPWWRWWAEQFAASFGVTSCHKLIGRDLLCRHRQLSSWERRRWRTWDRFGLSVLPVSTALFLVTLMSHNRTNVWLVLVLKQWK